MGYTEFMSNVDALVIGRTTFETVLAFDMDWPYTKPVFVISNTLTELPEQLNGKVFIVKGSLTSILKQIHTKGFNRLYIDGGKTIQSFLKEDLIDELILTTIPVLLGGGTWLFTELPAELQFELVSTKTYLNQVTQVHYKRER